MRARTRRARAILQRRSRITRGTARRRRAGVFGGPGAEVWSMSGLQVFMIGKYAPAPVGFHDRRPDAVQYVKMDRDAIERASHIHTETIATVRGTPIEAFIEEPATMYQEFHAEDCGNCWLMAQGSDKPYYCNKKSCDEDIPAHE